MQFNYISNLRLFSQFLFILFHKKKKKAQTKTNRRAGMQVGRRVRRQAGRRTPTKKTPKKPKNKKNQKNKTTPHTNNKKIQAGRRVPRHANRQSGRKIDRRSSRHTGWQADSQARRQEFRRVRQTGGQDRHAENAVTRPRPLPPLHPSPQLVSRAQLKTMSLILTLEQSKSKENQKKKKSETERFTTTHTAHKRSLLSQKYQSGSPPGCVEQFDWVSRICKRILIGC